MSKAENNARVEAELESGTTRRNGDRARMPCPFCEDGGHKDRKFSLSVSTINGLWHCFRCGTSGKLSSYDEVDYRDRDDEGEELEEYEKPEEFVPLAGNRSLTLRPARKYLLGKGRYGRPVPVPKSVWAKADLHACADGFWSERIIVPVKTTDGMWLGWISRIWYHEPPPQATGLARMKYLYPRGMDRGAQFYNHRALAIKTDRPVMLVEGAFDTFNLWNDAVATLGDLSEPQMEALKLCERPICIVFDGDAWRKGWALAARLRFDGLRAGYVRLPAGEDPDEVPRDWLLEEARRSIDARL